jgi:hypothetical protein
MPKFTVVVQRIITEAAEIEFTAASDEKAKEQVMALLNDPNKRDTLGSIDWELQDEEFDFLECNEA